MFAEVILNSNAKALNKVFDYHVPKEYESIIHIGSRVFVPFGFSKRLEDGFVINIKTSSDYANKGIAKVLEEDYLTEFKINLAKLMARKYFCNVSECIKLMLPPGTGTKELSNRVKEKTGNFVYLNKNFEEIEENINLKVIKSEKQIRVLRFLQSNEGIYKSDLEALTDVSSVIIKTLEKNGYIKIEEEQIRRNPFINKEIKKDKAKILNKEQQECFDKINEDIKNNRYSCNLIFGVTGSRKNRNLLKINRRSIK